MERVTGIEPAFSAWEADVLPLNYTRIDGPRADDTIGKASGRAVACHRVFGSSDQVSARYPPLGRP
jgi:hypothetical protein